MASVKQLEAQLAAMTALLAAHGIREPGAVGRSQKKNADFVDYGSPEHRIFLGLIEVEKEDLPEARDEYGYLIHRSKTSGKHFRLEDEITQFLAYPDPAQVALLVLRQKVSSFECGPPQVPADAPALLRTDLVPF